ncbi:YcjF family protein [Pseudogemmobacter sp. W21_MBD1_M6]|uniref:YcjF family protein n=1 Tax=Pseudogemmobacter sp. W21_MBD1_M6 TaxID=3240271 RepID=UPI003F97DF9D
MKKPVGPVLIEFDADAPAATPDAAPAVPDLMTEAPTGKAMEMLATLAARKPSRLARWFWTLLSALLAFVVSIAAWDFVNGMIARNPVLGYTALVLTGLFVAVLLAIAVKELASFARLKRLDAVHRAAVAALAAQDLGAARKVTDQIAALYAGRADVRWGLDRLAEHKGDMFDADALLGLAEREVIAPLDLRAMREVEAAARQVATVTAIVPLALADVAAALTGNLRMIRRVAEVYGGRAGTLGSWRLTRTVLTHLVATGAVAVGDDLIQSIAGGGLLSKISRRFGEGVVNGALTARVGVAAMEVCRPMPFHTVKRPSVTGLVQRALTGLFSR